MRQVFAAALLASSALILPAAAQTASGPGNVPTGYPGGNGAVSLPAPTSGAVGPTAGPTTTTTTSPTAGGTSVTSGTGGSSSTAAGVGTSAGRTRSGTNAPGSPTAGSAAARGGGTGSVQMLCPRSTLIDDTPFLFGTDLSCGP